MTVAVLTEAQAFAELDAVLSLEELEKKQTAINALNVSYAT